MNPTPEREEVVEGEEGEREKRRGGGEEELLGGEEKKERRGKEGGGENVLKLKFRLLCANCASRSCGHFCAAIRSRHGCSSGAARSGGATTGSLALCWR